MKLTPHTFLFMMTAMLVAVPTGLAQTESTPEHVCGMWVRETLTHIVRYQQNPLRATRNLSLVAAACNDAALSTRSAVDSVVVAHLAAAKVLAYLYPQDSPGKLTAKGRYLAGLSLDRGIRQAELSVAKTIGALASMRALRDGADAVWSQRFRPAPAAGIWRAAAPLFMSTPLEPLAATWTTWILKTPDEFATPAPEPYGTDAYWAAVHEVFELSRALTDEQKTLADDWHLGAGSVTPAGVWNLRTLSIIKKHKLSHLQSARVLAALNVAMADAQIASWHVKYKYWTIRPVNVIQEHIDPDWLPYLITPVFPSYVSGHATVSGAAAEVIACNLPEEADFARAMANEAALSRLYGGIHFREDNDEGLKLGAAIGRKVCEELAMQHGNVRWLGEKESR